MVSEQFVSPSLLKMMGHRSRYRRIIQVPLEEDTSKVEALTFFLRARIERHEGRYRIMVAGDQRSGILKSMAKANGLVVLPEDITEVKTGDEVAVQLVDHGFCTIPEPRYP